MAFKVSVLLVVVGYFSIGFAARYQTLLYRPHGPLVARPLPYSPSIPPRTMPLPYRPSGSLLAVRRIRRAAIGGEAKSNPAGGVDVKLTAAQGVGDPIHNVAAGVLAVGNTQRGPVTTAGQLEYNLGGHQLSLNKMHTPGDRDVFKQNARVNIFDDGRNKFDANVFKSETSLANGFDFKTRGGSLNWSNDRGHSAFAEVSKIPNYGTNYELGATANLWQSRDESTKLDLYGSASKRFGGPFDGQKNFGGGLSLTSLFG